jgi:chorismate synthase
MAGNTFGKIFTLTTFGESHGDAIGGIIDGCPSGLEIDFQCVKTEMNRRRPGQSAITTARAEADEVQFLSGIFEGKTLGTPIGFIIRNQDQKSKDYDYLHDKFRPSHADFTYAQKYGMRDYRGGGRSSARETACRVVAGAIAKLFLKKQGIKIHAYTSQVGAIKINKPYNELNLLLAEENAVRCADAEKATEMIAYIENIKQQGDTVGGLITCVIQHVPAGLGEPVFDKLQAALAAAMMSINAAKGFEIGSGFSAAAMLGSQHNDNFYSTDGEVKRGSNNAGGIEGGISNGEDIVFNVAFKPVATILKTQQTINSSFENVEIKNQGRHDPCILPRAVPIVEAMAALVIMDYWLQNINSKII